MIKQIKLFIGVLALSSSLHCFANNETCSQIYNNQNFTGVILNKNKFISCCYKQASPFGVPNCYEQYGNYLPTSGPWNPGVGNTVICSSLISSDCIFEKVSQK